MGSPLLYRILIRDIRNEKKPDRKFCQAFLNKAVKQNSFLSTRK